MQTIDHPFPQSFVMPHPHAAAAKAPHSACQASDPLPLSGRNFLAAATLSLLALPLVSMFSAAPALAADSALSAPVLGYLHDSESATVRPIHGIPGASLLSDPLALPWSVTRAAMTPAGDLVLITGESTAWVLSANGARREIPGLATLANASKTDLFLSPDGSAAAFRNREANLLEIVTGLPDQPVIAHRSDTQFAAGALAVSDDGTLVLTAGPDGVYLTDTSGGVERVAEAGLGAAFRPRSHEYALLLSGESVLWKAAEARQWDASQGVHSAVAARFSNDGRTLWIANADGTLLAIGANGAIERADCGCQPDRLSTLTGNAVALTGGLTRTPMKLATAGSEGLKLFFVPAPEPGISTGGDQNR